MKNGCKDILEAKVADRNERAKKLYCYVTDVARRVSETTTSSRSITDLFATHLEVQRQKLRDNCEKLLFLDPLNYGKKAIELLWRKVYYEVVYAAKKLRESDNEYDSYLFTHIVCGIGHFHHFITRIQSEMKLHFKELDYIPLHKDEETGESNLTPGEEELQFGKFALHSCLIYLGDLSRYQAEIFHTFDSSIAARYYLQAAHIDMSSGMPFNQLGNLYLDKNYNLDSVCYYIHCLSCASPFDGAMGNLTKIFEKNSQFCETLNISESLTQTEHIQNTIANFLSLIEIWYLGSNDTNIPQRCNTIAHELKIALEFEKSPLPDMNKNYDDYVQAIEEESINPSYFNCNLVHKTVLICLLTMSKMIETDEAKAFACKAFTLALLSQLLQKLLQQIESFGLKNPAHNYRTKVFHAQHSKLDEQTEKLEKQESAVVEKAGVNDVKNTVDSQEETLEKITDNNEKLQNGDIKSHNNKKTPAKRRRRRRLASSESSDMTDADTESSEVDTDESNSDEDESSDSSYESEDVDVKSDDSMYDGTDTEECDTKLNGDVDKGELKDIKKEEELNGDIQINCSKSNDKNEALQIQDIQNFLLGNNFLPSIKLLQDWILTEKDLILSCGDSGETLFQCVVDLLNIFSYYFKSKIEFYENKDCKVLKYAKHVAQKFMLEYKTIPLPEDVNLRGTNICKFDKDAAEWQILDRYTPSVYEENIIRILNFIDFGNQIAKIVPRIRFNRSMKIFYLKKTQPPKLNTKINQKRSREWHNSKKHMEAGGGGTNAAAGGTSGLLRRLGRLWLASQVRELERSGRAAAAAAPALLVLDSAALNIHLRKVKHLLRARNFILLIPSVVLQELDNLKREQSTARDAIRWLEIQLKSGSRFLRAQRPGQSRPLPLLKYPRKAPPHVHNYIQILEFCNHFIADEKQGQGGNGDPDSAVQGKSTPLLILLVGNEPSIDEQHKDFSLTGAAQAAAISVEHISDFYTKWRQSVHKNGKKR